MAKEFLTRFLSDEGRQTLLEYTLLLTVIGALSLVMLTAAGINVERFFGQTLTLATHAKAHLGTGGQ